MARRAPAHTRTDLLKAAEECFAEHGLEATKVEDITSRAGIAKGAFYSYFERKEDCWKEIVDAFLVRLAGACEPSARMLSVTPGEPIDETFDRILAHDVQVLEFCWTNRALLRMLLSGAGGASYAYLLDEFATRAAKNVEAVVRTFMEAGLYREDTEPSIIATLIGGAYDRLVRELVQRSKRPDVEALCRQTHRLFMLGLLSDSARAQMERSVTSTRMARIPSLPSESAGQESPAGRANSGGRRRR